MKIRNLLLVLFIWCSGTLSAMVYTPDNLPNPHTWDATDYVCNPDGLLRQNTCDSINAICQRLQQQLEVEMVVIAVNRFDEENYSPFDFCQVVGNTWGIGSKERSTGIIIFLATESRDIRLHTGTGMEGVLPDAICTDIRYDMSNYLAEGDWNSGLLRGCQLIEQQLQGDDVQAELLLGYVPKTQKHTGWYIYFMFALIALIAAAVAIYSISNSANLQLSKSRFQSFRTQGESITKVLMLIFPVPCVLLYLYFRRLCQQVRRQPIPCSVCNGQMEMVSEADEHRYLTPVQQTEKRLKVIDYDVFRCASCGHTHGYKYPNQQVMRQYTKCETCGGYTAVVASKQVVEHATYSHSGTGAKQLECKHCGVRWTENYTIPKKERSQGPVIIGGPGSSRGEFGGGFGGGSFGGGGFSGGGSGGKF